jgi:adenylate kinase family enzyme
MKKIIVIGCPGAGKSTFSRKLSEKTGLPIHYLDMIWHLPDRTTLSREEFVMRLGVIMAEKEWIIDGNYIHSLPLRLNSCDTVFSLTCRWMFVLQAQRGVSGRDV